MPHGPIWQRIRRNWATDRAERRPPSFAEARDMTAAVGAEGGPADWRRASAAGGVALHERDWADSVWSSIYRRDTSYAVDGPVDPEQIGAANLRGRRGRPPETVHGPFLHAPVWTWEVPLYFWFGGMAAGATFIAAGADLAGDHRSARIARRVAFAALMPSPPLLVMDLGRPERFHHMLRIFKPRSPMSTGSWCLSLFGALSFAGVAADLLHRPRTARALGVLNLPVGAYLGSYTGVLLAATAVPVWGRSRSFLGPIFISTGVLSGAGATRLTLSATGMGPEHPTRSALARIEDAALAAELILSAINRHRLGPLAEGLERGLGAPWFKRASRLGRAGLGARLLSRRAAPVEHLASVLFMAAALSYRFAWVGSGRSNADDDAAIAANARARVSPAQAAVPAAEPAPVLRVTQHG